MLTVLQWKTRSYAAQRCARLAVVVVSAIALNGWTPALAAGDIVPELPGQTNKNVAGVAAKDDMEARRLPDVVRRAELVTLVRQDCGSCHGMTLKGGLGPALLPEFMKDKSAAYLKTVILYGRPDTAMPPWQRFLSEADAEWIVVNLQKGFPSAH